MLCLDYEMRKLALECIKVSMLPSKLGTLRDGYPFTILGKNSVVAKRDLLGGRLNTFSGKTEDPTHGLVIG